MMRRVRFAIGQAVTSMVRAPLIQLVAVSTIGAAVMVFCLLQVVTNTAEQFVADFSGKVGLVVFMKPNTEPQLLDQITKGIEALEGVQNNTLVTPETALASLEQSLGKERFIRDGIDPSLLPISIQVELKNDGPTDTRERIEAILSTTGAHESIQFIDTGDDLSSRLEALTELVRLFGGLVALLVTIAVLFVISNTMRLAIHAREKEIEIMQWVGAGHMFIRAPFYIEGCIQGLVSAGIAVVATRGLIQLGPSLAAKLPEEFQNFQLQALSNTFEIGLSVGLLLIGLIASHLATSRYFRQQSSLWFS